MSNIQRIDSNDATGLLGRIELERLAGNVQVRRYGPTLALIETRAATPREAAAYGAWEFAFITDTNRTSLFDKGTQALAANATFLALASPTNPQVLTQVQRLTRQMDALIRLVMDKLDDISDT